VLARSASHRRDKLNRSITAASVAFILSAGLVQAQNIGLNGGFELGTGGDSDFWNEFGGGAAGTASFRSSANPIAGNWSHQLTAIGSGLTGAAAGINFNSIDTGGLPSLAEFSTLSLSFDAEVDFGPGGVGFFTLAILDATGAIVSSTGLQPLFTGSLSSAVLNVPAFGAAPSDAYAAFVEIVVNAGAFDGSTAGALIDNVVINGTLVPAPGTLALLGLSMLGTSRRRR
jgi:hypothetical protein